PDVICGHHPLEGNKPFPLSFATLYRRIKEGEFNIKFLLMKGKRNPNGHKETRGKQAFTRNIAERISILIITVKPEGNKAIDVQKALDGLFKNIPRNLFKSITFECRKEFSNGKETANEHDIDIYFCDPGTPSQRPLNEH